MCLHQTKRMRESLLCEQNLSIHSEKRVISTQSFLTVCTAQNLSIHVEKMGTFLKSCKIYIFLFFFGTFKLVFLQKFFNQEGQISIKIKNIPKNPFEKSLRNISIHLKLLTSSQGQKYPFSMTFLPAAKREDKICPPQPGFCNSPT